MICLKEVRISDKDRLWNIFQKYFYEMSNYYDMDMDETGNYQYKYFENYFEESNRTALFLYWEEHLCTWGRKVSSLRQNDETLIGFAMINDYSCLGNDIDYAMGEFTVFPRYRKQHLGGEAVRKIFESYRGKWEIKYSNENKAAKAFWERATREYKPVVSSYDGTETVLSFNIG